MSGSSLECHVVDHHKPGAGDYTLLILVARNGRDRGDLIGYIPSIPARVVVTFTHLSSQLGYEVRRLNADERHIVQNPGVVGDLSHQPGV
jgi:hypothetical protein